MKVYEILAFPMSLDDFTLVAKRYPGAKAVNVQGQLLAVDDEFQRATNCWCSVCDSAVRNAKYEVDGDVIGILCLRMILCPDCGNKRCPKAASHDHQCTGSNEPGQPGSNYPAPAVCPPAPEGVDRVQWRLDWIDKQFLSLRDKGTTT